MGSFSSEEEWRKHMADRVNPDEYQFQKQPAEKNMCVRLAFNDPKVLRLMQDELDSES